MIKKKELIGVNAGIVWRTLNASHGKMAFGELIATTMLNPIELGCAIGWLAREDKIMIIEEYGKAYFTIYHECYY